MRTEWSRRADRDLDRVEDCIAQENPTAALEARERIEQQIRLLKKQPKIGRQGRVPGTRELVITALPYIVVYRVKSKAIQIIRVLHGAQQSPR